MLYYSKMRWELKGMTFDQLWDLEAQEARAAAKSIEDGIVSHLYKVVAEQYVVSIGGSADAEGFDRYAFGVLPMREHLTFETVLPLEEGFSIDVFPYLKERRAKMAADPRFLFLVELSWAPRERMLDEAWPALVRTLKSDAPVKVLGLFRVAGQQRALAVIDVKDAADLNRFALMPVLGRPAVDLAWSLRDYIAFADDVENHFRPDPAA
jgi:muconolactone delta-isomerase